MKKEAFMTDWRFCAQGEPWETVTLPHDATQTRGRDAAAPSGRSQAFFRGGSYAYEKRFYAPTEWESKTVLLAFEGVYPRCRVTLNGAVVGESTYGYSGFTVELNDLEYGEENTVRVEIEDETKPSDRWYAGAGIYRPVWLYTAPRKHIVPDGVRVSTVSIAPAAVRVDTQTVGQADEIAIAIYQGDALVASGAGQNAEITVPNAALWDAEHPNLYTCVVKARFGAETDSEQVRFGIRSLAWGAAGLKVNGKKVLLKGGCIHSDNGILGSRSLPAFEWYRIKTLKQYGFNAIRSAHDPLCRAALEACDELGMYVLDELWDYWDSAKSPGDYASRFPAGHNADMADIVRKDYNHPSVLLYSIGNEVTEPAKPEGVALAKSLVATLHELDGTRPVTAGINITLLMLASMGINLTVGGGNPQEKPQEKMDSTAYNKLVFEQGARMTMAAATPQADTVSTPVLDCLDIAGYNYAVSRYEGEGALHPERLVLGTETYPQELGRTWPLIEKHPWLAGDFMWTAWDYLGEVGIGSWSYDGDEAFAKNYPWLLADTGALDILGNETAEAALAAAVFGAKRLSIAVQPVNHPGTAPVKAMWRGSNGIPSWSWRGCDGNEATVEVYTAGREAELYVNGKAVGRAPVEDYRAVFRVPYAPGTLQAICYDAAAAKVGEAALHSATGPLAPRLTELIRRDGVALLAAELVGENGEVESAADTEFTCAVQGGQLLAFGSARPKTEESFLSGRYRSYYGRALAAVRLGQNTVVTLRAGDQTAQWHA